MVENKETFYGKYILKALMQIYVGYTALETFWRIKMLL